MATPSLNSYRHITDAEMAAIKAKGTSSLTPGDYNAVRAYAYQNGYEIPKGKEAMLPEPDAPAAPAPPAGPLSMAAPTTEAAADAQPTGDHATLMRAMLSPSAQPAALPRPGTIGQPPTPPVASPVPVSGPLAMTAPVEPPPTIANVLRPTPSAPLTVQPQAAPRGPLAVAPSPSPTPSTGVSINWDKGGAQNDLKYKTLMSHGVNSLGATPTGAAGMLGNAYAESNFRVAAYNPTGEKSHGLFQWNEDAGRWAPYVDWAQKNNKPVYDPYSQFEYAKVESQGMKMNDGSGRSVWDAVNSAKSSQEASNIWLDNFEKPKVRDYSNRGGFADTAMSSYDPNYQAPPPATATASADPATTRPPIDVTAPPTPGPLAPASDPVQSAGAAPPAADAPSGLASLFGGSSGGGGMQKGLSMMTGAMGGSSGNSSPSPFPQVQIADAHAPDMTLAGLLQRKRLSLLGGSAQLPTTGIFG